MQAAGPAAAAGWSRKQKVLLGVGLALACGVLLAAVVAVRGGAPGLGAGKWRGASELGRRCCCCRCAYNPATCHPLLARLQALARTRACRCLHPTSPSAICLPVPAPAVADPDAGPEPLPVSERGQERKSGAPAAPEPQPPLPAEPPLDAGKAEAMKAVETGGENSQEADYVGDAPKQVDDAATIAAVDAAAAKEEKDAAAAAAAAKAAAVAKAAADAKAATDAKAAADAETAADAKAATDAKAAAAAKAKAAAAATPKDASPEPAGKAPQEPTQGALESRCSRQEWSLPP